MTEMRYSASTLLVALVISLPAFGQLAVPSDSYFGMSVATDGTTALIGAPSETTPDAEAGGAVYVFQRSGGWHEEARLTPPDPSPYDNFGYAVDVDGTWAIVGAPDDHTLDLHAGSAYVFRKDGDAWSMRRKLLPEETFTGTRFGAAVALDGDLALVGAPMPGSGEDAAGAVFVFRNDGGIWSLEERLQPPAATTAHFGAAVALSGSVALVGAPYAGGQAPEAGAAYVFERGAGGWQLTATLTASDGVANAFFGQSVALDGSRALVGAYMHPAETGEPAGAAYVFHQAQEGWIEEARLTAPDAVLNDFFGSSVALSGKTAAVGAVRRDDGARTDAGAVYLFRRLEGGTWSEGGVIVPTDIMAYDLFGSAVALNGEDLIVGAPLKDLPEFDSGAAYFLTVESGTGTSAETNMLPSSFDISPLYPNPFREATTLTLSLPETAPVKAEVFDAVGRRVAVLEDRALPAGTHVLRWQGAGFPAGVYFVQLRAGLNTRTLQGVLVR